MGCGAQAAPLLGGGVTDARAILPVFFGKSFSVLLVQSFRAPETLPVAFIVWAVVLLVGFVLLGVGFWRVMRWKLDDVPVRSSAVAVAVCIIILWQGWSLPRAWGPLVVTGGDVVCRAVLFAALVNLWLALAVRSWWQGFAAGEDRAQALRHVVTMTTRDGDEWLQGHEQGWNECLLEMGRQRDASQDLKSFVEILGGRRAVLALLHPDNKPESEKLAATERFQKAGQILARIEGARR